MKHTCHARGCELVVPPKMLMCSRHWFMLPKSLRDAVWRAYVPGQEIRKDPTPEYLKVADAAIEWLANREAELAAQKAGKAKKQGDLFE